MPNSKAYFDTNQLHKLGLSAHEMQIFVATFELGSASAARIAKHAAVPRTTSYTILSRLADIGLVSVEKRRGAQHYVAASADALVRLAEERLDQAQADVIFAKELAKKLQSQHSRDMFLAKSKVLIFEGEQSIRSMLYDWDKVWRDSMIKAKLPWLGFQDDTFLRHYGDWVVDYWKKFSGLPNEQQNILKVFSIESAIVKSVANTVKSAAGDRRNLIPLVSAFNFTATLWVIGEYVITIDTRKKIHTALLLRDSTTAANLAAIFQHLWGIMQASRA
jgi:predicted transcriptional regulator